MSGDKTVRLWFYSQHLFVEFLKSAGLGARPQRGVGQSPTVLERKII